MDFIPGRSITVLRRQHTWYLEDGTAKQVKLVDCFMFQEVVLLMGFQSETYSVGRQSNI